jgi:hypothetical protein
MTDGLDGRCGSCARFVRVVEKIDGNGEVRRAGECLLGVWPPPLYENNTCNRYVRKGTFTAPKPKPTREPSRPRPNGAVKSSAQDSTRAKLFTLPAEILDMSPDEFREVLRDVIREELGAIDVEMGSRWEGGEMILKPGKEGTADKRVPIEAFFHKVVMIRDRLRVLEQRINAHPKLGDEEKVALEQYITACYGTLTTFNVLFADKDDGFVGQKDGGDKDPA